MRFLDLFAGIGGFSLGLERAGMVCAGQVEIDGFCNQVLEKHWPNVKRLKDIREVNGNEFTAVELICGGFPCQPFSLAGKRRGAADDRYLWPEMLRIIQTIRPHWVCGENVAGIIDMALDTVLSELEGIGYSVQALVIPACAINAPHKRDRIWIIANSASNGFANRPYTSNSFLAWSQSSNPVEQQYRRAGQAGGNVIKHWLEAASRFCRVDDGLPGRVDRLKCLGNAVIPGIVEVIGRAILETESAFENYGSDQHSLQQPLGCSYAVK